MLRENTKLRNKWCHVYLWLMVILCIKYSYVYNNNINYASKFFPYDKQYIFPKLKMFMYNFELDIKI